MILDGWILKHDQDTVSLLAQGSLAELLRTDNGRGFVRITTISRHVRDVHHAQNLFVLLLHLLYPLFSLYLGVHDNALTFHMLDILDPHGTILSEFVHIVERVCR